MDQPTQRIGLLQFLENHLHPGIKWAVFAGLIASSIAGLNYVRDLRAEMRNERAARETLAQKFSNVGDSAITANQEQPAKAVNSLAQEAFGSGVVDYMKKANARIEDLTSALARIEGRITSVEGLSHDFAGKQDATGALHQFPIDESRRDSAGKVLPSLGRFVLSYDPRQRDPATAFAGSYWVQHRQDFKIDVGEWKEHGKGGLKTTVSLTRAVYQADPNNPSAWIPAGVEQIPVVDGSTVYTPDGLLAAPRPMPRWTAIVGVGKQNGKYEPTGIVDYRLTQKIGLSAGVANNTPVLGFSFRFGAPK